MAAPDEQQAVPGLWNAANALTLVRFVLVPVFLWLLFRDGGDNTASRIAAWATFSVAMVTDRLDGELARRRGLVTDVGKIADPIADKALTGAAFIGLSILGELPWWVTVVVLVREWGVTALRFAVLRYGVLPANRGGKIKTALQGLALSLYILLLPASWEPVQAGAMALAVSVTVVTGVDYVLQALRMWQTSSRSTAAMMPAADALVRDLARAGTTVATAESLTGGLLAAALTAVSGASAVVRGGVVAYATDLKSDLAGVPEDVLRRDGPVAAATAAAMAEGVRLRCGATYGVATTGVAGPDPQDGHPPGTLHVAVAGPDGTNVASFTDLEGDRDAVRTSAVRLALDLLATVTAAARESHGNSRR